MAGRQQAVSLRRCRVPSRFLVAVVAMLATGPAHPSAAPPPKTGPVVAPADVRWLDRVTFGIDAAALERFQRLGRERFLDEQLHPPADDPEPLAAAVRTIPGLAQSAEDRVRALRAEQQRINGLPSDDERQKARMALNQAGNQAVYESARRHLMRALRSPYQLREQLTWFWMNHFSVFADKANVRWMLAEYEERAVRPNALGKFRDLVLATVTSPAMLEYLDNAQSAAGKINENYARELMELHTLGVSGGQSGSSYSQQDVQELARILTGVGVNATGTTPRLPAERQALYIRRGLFEFNPARHDFGTKTFLGRVIGGTGFDEVEQAVTLLCRQPATARFISRKLARYFVADDPPPALVERMARTFERTDGSMAAVLREMFLDRDLLAGLAAPGPRFEKFRDPMRWVVAALRLAYEGQVITNYHPVVNWLQQLGEPLYRHVTPEGYALAEAAWTSSGQLVRRLEVAKAIGSGNAGLFNSEDGPASGPGTGFPRLASRLYFGTIEPILRAATRDALDQAASQVEWNTTLLASPDLMER